MVKMLGIVERVCGRGVSGDHKRNGNSAEAEGGRGSGEGKGGGNSGSMESASVTKSEEWWGSGRKGQRAWGIYNKGMADGVVARIHGSLPHP